MEILLITFLLIAAFLFFLFRKNKVSRLSMADVPEKWKPILAEKVDFYQRLDKDGKKHFELDVLRFLSTIQISGVQTDVTLADRLLVASSAVIPLFGFPEWSYSHLDEVLIYPSSFDRNYQMGSTEEVITGMVGSGPMEGKMILSKPALHHGFSNTSDKKNVGIHEFVHLFDKEDGVIDGVPPGFDSKEYAVPWVNFMRAKIRDIVAKKSDIDGYATTNYQEFCAVASEYFFERPHLLRKKHPELYETLSKVFNQTLAENWRKDQTSKAKTIGRNEKCPCGSGLKYKRCCLV